jgi:shikimate dehydrogenase
VVWELNYRGELDFLHHAREQADERALTIEDGWIYFINGWSAVMEEVFERPITEADLQVLAAEAEFARP